MGDKGFVIMFIVIMLSIVGLFKACESPERKKFNEYSDKFSSCMSELRSSSGYEKKRIKKKFNSLIQKYNTWKKHAGISYKSSYDKKSAPEEHIDYIIEEYNNYNKVESRTNKTIYIGKN